VRAGRSGESEGTRSGCDFRAARLYASRICCWVAFGEMERIASWGESQWRWFLSGSTNAYSSQQARRPCCSLGASSEAERVR